MAVILPDFAAIHAGETTFAAVADSLTVADLRAFTNEAYDHVEAALAPADDGAITFVPADPHLREGDTEGAWSVAHVVVHLTAGMEEGGAIASALARGVLLEGRPRYETPWQSIVTRAQVQQRLAESRRMSLAFLDTWPDEPHLDLAYTPIPRFGPLNAPARYLVGIGHAEGHVEQMRDAIRQAAATGPTS